jgi:hypothetical protein
MSALAAAAARPRRRWIWITVAVVTALTIVLPAGLRVWLKADMEHQAQPLAVYRQPVGTLQVSVPGGNVTIRPGRPGQVTVASTLSWVFARPAVTHARRGRDLLLGVRCPGLNAFSDCQASLTIRVPSGVAVQASVGAGTIDVAGLTGPLHLATTSGSIELTDVSGPVWAESASGSIAAPSGLASPRLAASVTSGTIALTFDSAPDRLVVATGAGAASITVPPGTRYRIVGFRSRGPGSLSFQPGLSDPHAARLITLRVGAGSVAIKYPSG